MITTTADTACVTRSAPEPNYVTLIMQIVGNCLTVDTRLMLLRLVRNRRTVAGTSCHTLS
jgi:hypothetical protein